MHSFPVQLQGREDSGHSCRQVPQLLFHFSGFPSQECHKFSDQLLRWYREVHTGQQWKEVFDRGVNVSSMRFKSSPSEIRLLVRLQASLSSTSTWMSCTSSESIQIKNGCCVRRTTGPSFTRQTRREKNSSSMASTHLRPQMSWLLISRPTDQVTAWEILWEPLNQRSGVARPLSSPFIALCFKGTTISAIRTDHRSSLLPFGQTSTASSLWREGPLYCHQGRIERGFSNHWNAREHCSRYFDCRFLCAISCWIWHSSLVGSEQKTADFPKPLEAPPKETYKQVEQHLQRALILERH